MNKMPLLQIRNTCLILFFASNPPGMFTELDWMALPKNNNSISRHWKEANARPYAWTCSDMWVRRGRVPWGEGRQQFNVGYKMEGSSICKETFQKKTCLCAHAQVHVCPCRRRAGSSGRSETRLSDGEPLADKLSDLWNNEWTALPQRATAKAVEECACGNGRHMKGQGRDGKRAAVTKSEDRGLGSRPQVIHISLEQHYSRYRFETVTCV